MVCCLNPECKNPNNPDGTQFCQSCQQPLIEKLDGRYRVMQLLGQGGFGRTYRAENTRRTINPACVVKQLAPAKNKKQQGSNKIDPIVLDLFEREARLLEKLEGHSQIPRFIDYFDFEGFFYLVQDFVEGKTLDQELAQKGLYSEAEVREFLQNLLPVLAYVHQRGVIHRDLKPANIMRRRDGQLILIDFGVSTELEESLQTRHSTIAPGTLGYAAYEQRHKIVKPTSDLFSVGVICFHLLTGKSPSDLSYDYGFSWTQNWRNQLPQGVVISKPLTSVMDRLLQRDYQQRYQSAEEVLQDLTRAEQQGVVFPNVIPPPNQPAIQEPTSTVATQNFTEDLNGVPLEMIYIPAGSFEMGSSKGIGHDDEHPQHHVDVPAFYMGKYPVTQAQYTAIMGKNPSYFKGLNLPVETVNWFEAVEFCQKLSVKSGHQYRLPSEAEWEYACRANTKTQYSFGDDPAKLGDYAWYGNNSGDQPIDALQIWQPDKGNYFDRLVKNKCRTHPVGEKKPNDWGLYDMYGNVWEWCQDQWHKNYRNAPIDGSAWIDKSNSNNSLRLLRGGSWADSPRYCRSASRNWIDAVSRYDPVGFRVVCTAARTQA